MPELPEVETIRRGLARRIKGKRVAAVEVKKARLVRGTVRAFRQVLVGQVVSGVERRGKLLAFKLGAGRQYLIGHLKMTGQLIYRGDGRVVAGGHGGGEQIKELPNKYSHIIFTFKDGSQLFFNDQRQFGYMQIVSAKQKEATWQTFGIDPLDRHLYTFGKFRAALMRRKTMLKAALLDQTVIAGIGNIYADEICFAAKVKPQRRINTLTEAERKVLYRVSLRVMTAAVRARGTTFSDYRDDEGRLGGFRKLLKVYGRGGEACRRCRVRLKKIRVAGRGTVYCEKCQY